MWNNSVQWMEPKSSVCLRLNQYRERYGALWWLTLLASLLTAVLAAGVLAAVACAINGQAASLRVAKLVFIVVAVSGTVARLIRLTARRQVDLADDRIIIKSPLTGVEKLSYGSLASFAIVEREWGEQKQTVMQLVTKGTGIRRDLFVPDELEAQRIVHWLRYRNVPYYCQCVGSTAN
ncbi:MAG: hypothetical protein J7K75_10380 [Desulfuromonas sp.]|nr:hypothetical protein [Desulfuromonas sp.]